jgi:hypothetical protein
MLRSPNDLINVTPRNDNGAHVPYRHVSPIFEKTNNTIGDQGFNKIACLAFSSKKIYTDRPLKHLTRWFNRISYFWLVGSSVRHDKRKRSKRRTRLAGGRMSISQSKRTPIYSNILYDRILQKLKEKTTKAGSHGHGNAMRKTAWPNLSSHSSREPPCPHGLTWMPNDYFPK